MPQRRATPRPRCLAAAALALAWLAPSCAGQCQNTTVLVTVGLSTAEVEVGPLAQGAENRTDCSTLHQGYSGSLVFSCVEGGIQTSYEECLPLDCEAGLVGYARLGDEEERRQIVSNRRLNHLQIWSFQCSALEEGWQGSVWTRCAHGELQADASRCWQRSMYDGPRKFWRLVNWDYLKGTWRIYEVSFFTDEDCVTGSLRALPGIPVAASEDTFTADGDKLHAFDGNRSTAWSARCEGGCDPGVAWIGVALDEPADRVRCVKLVQSTVACCMSHRVRLEVWDGSRWQVMQEWDTQTLANTPMTNRVTWLIGEQGASCSEACGEVGLLCNSDIRGSFSIQKMNFAVQQKVPGQSCAIGDQETQWSDAFHPAWVGQECVGTRSIPPLVSCDASGPQAMRACKCFQDGVPLRIPITCEEGMPVGVGVQHDCEGAPVVGKQEGQSCTASCSSGYYGPSEEFICQGNGAFMGTAPTCLEAETVSRAMLGAAGILGVLLIAQQYRFWYMGKKVRLGVDPEAILEQMKGRWFEKEGKDIWAKILELKEEEAQAAILGINKDKNKKLAEAEELLKDKKSKKKREKAMEKRREALEVGDRVKVLIADKLLVWKQGVVCSVNPLKVQAEGWNQPWTWEVIEAIDLENPMGKKEEEAEEEKEKEEAHLGEMLKDKTGCLTSICCCCCIGDEEPMDVRRKRSDGSSPPGSPRSPRGEKSARERRGSAGSQDAAEKEKKTMKAALGFLKRKDNGDRKYFAPRVFLDGLCSPCMDPDVFWALVCCPVCRIADTWHTVADPAWLGFWTSFFLFLTCPCMWPCLNFWNRLRIRRAFGIEREPHRDCLVHVCCCCCCAPCALCQEARLVDAPNNFWQAERRLGELKAEGLRA